MSREQKEYFCNKNRLAEKLFLMQVQRSVDRENDGFNPDETMERLYCRNDIDNMIYWAELIAEKVTIFLKDNEIDGSI